MVNGYYILEKINGSNYYIYDFNKDQLIKDIAIIDIKDLCINNISTKLNKKLQLINFEFPQLPEPPKEENYKDNISEFYYVKKRYDQEVEKKYKDAILECANKNKDEVYIHNQSLVFLEKGLSFRLGYLGYNKEIPALTSNMGIKIVGVKHNSPEYPVYILKKGKAITGIIPVHYSFGIPFYGWNYTYYYKMVCDNKNFYFKNENDLEYEIVDYEVNENKIYFALSSERSFYYQIYLYEYNR